MSYVLTFPTTGRSVVRMSLDSAAMARERGRCLLSNPLLTSAENLWIHESVTPNSTIRWKSLRDTCVGLNNSLHPSQVDLDLSFESNIDRRHISLTLAFYFS